MNTLQDSKQNLLKGEIANPVVNCPASSSKGSNDKPYGQNIADTFLLNMYDEVRTHFDSFDISVIPQLNIALRYYAHHSDKENMKELINMVAGITSVVELISELKTHCKTIESYKVAALKDENSIFFQPLNTSAQ